MPHPVAVRLEYMWTTTNLVRIIMIYFACEKMATFVASLNLPYL